MGRDRLRNVGSDRHHSCYFDDNRLQDEFMICEFCSYRWHKGCKGGTWCDCQHQGAENPYGELIYRLGLKHVSEMMRVMKPQPVIFAFDFGLPNNLRARHIFAATIIDPSRINIVTEV